MTRHEAYDAVLQRMCKPENKERLEQAIKHEDSHSKGRSIWWHKKRAENMLESLASDTNEVNRGVYKYSFDSSLEAIKRMMNEQGWA